MSDLKPLHKKTKSVRHLNPKEDGPRASPSQYHQRRQSRKSFSTRAKSVASLYLDPLEASRYPRGKFVIVLKLISLLGIFLTCASGILSLFAIIKVVQSQKSIDEKFSAIRRAVPGMTKEIKNTNSSLYAVISNRSSWKIVQEITGKTLPECNVTYNFLLDEAKQFEISSQRKYLTDLQNIIKVNGTVMKGTVDALKMIKIRSTTKGEVMKIDKQIKKLEKNLLEAESLSKMVFYDDCSSVGATESGIYNITIRYNFVKVYCDMDTVSGEWLVIQRRIDDSVDFNRGWEDYAKGFGDLEGNYWIGLRNLYEIMHLKKYTLRLDYWDFDGKHVHETYNTFLMVNEYSNFAIKVDDYVKEPGSLKDPSMQTNTWKPFSTKDTDTDNAPTIHCAEKYKGGWWYDSCVWYTYLNGPYRSRRRVSRRYQMDSIVAFQFSQENLKKAEMKIRTFGRKFT